MRSALPGAVLALCLLTGLVAGAENDVFTNVTASLNATGVYFYQTVAFELTLELKPGVTDPDTAACDPDCRYVLLSAHTTEVPSPFSDLSLLQAMTATLRGIPCSIRTSLTVPKIFCPYFVGPFPSDAPLTIPGTIRIDPFRGAHEHTNSPLLVSISVATDALPSSLLDAEPVSLTLQGYEPVTFTYTPHIMNQRHTASYIEATVISVSVIGIVISVGVLVVTVLLVFFVYDLNGKR